MFNRIPGKRVRQLTTATLAAAIVWLAAAWAPSPPRTHSPKRGTVEHGMAAVAGVYVLQRASGKRPPIPFAMSLAGGSLAGTVDGARVILSSDGSYTNDIVVTWTKAPMLPIPGLEADGKPHKLAGTGTYEVDGDRIILHPEDMFSRGVVRSVEAIAGDKTLDLRSASGGLAGSKVSIDAHFVRVRD